MKQDQASQKKPHVVIVGAGFGGLEAAKALSCTAVDVTLIDRHNYHLFQPLLYQVATAALTPAEIAAPIRHVVRKAKNIRVFMDNVSHIDTIKKTVLCDADRRISYDYLILATGARHSYFGRDEWESIAPGLKTIDDAFELRQRILTAFEQAEMEMDKDKRQAWLNFVIIGAGPTGVELAGAIAELARHSLTHDFRNITPKCARIILVDSGARVLAAFDEVLSAKAQKHLEDLGVNVILNTMVKHLSDDHVMLGDERTDCRTAIWAAGVQASPAGNWISAETDRTGRIFVESDLTVPGQPDIYAVGDTAAFTPEGAERPLPGIAPVAKKMGQYAARSILARVRNRKLPAFSYRDYGSMATIGRNKAIADFKGWKTSGFTGWILWSLAHVYFLIGFRSRLIVALNWAWAYLTWERGVRLITGRIRPTTKTTKQEQKNAA